MTRPDVRTRLAALVLGVHHRNGGTLASLPFEARLLDPSLRIDSLDLAEVMASVEREFGVSPFESSTPTTWDDLVRAIEESAPPPAPPP